MFYEVEVRTHIRVSPDSFDKDTKKAVFETLNKQFSNFISKELGIVVAVAEIKQIGDGILIPGDGAAYYDTIFTLITFKPELQEVLPGEISEITDFGAFLTIGPLEGMIHVSQTMDDFVTFSKSGVLTGKETKRTIKSGDKCRSRIVAVSYKEITNPKVGMTMRQPRLGPFSFIEQEIKREKLESKKEEKK